VITFILLIVVVFVVVDSWGNAGWWNFNSLKGLRGREGGGQMRAFCTLPDDLTTRSEFTALHATTWFHPV